MPNKTSLFLKIMLALGMLFLYLPLFILIIYSFNSSSLVTVWGGFSTKWYGELIRNETILSAAWLSVKIALISSLSAVILATFAGYALARIRHFKGNVLFTSMVSAPMVMPDVITGLSMLMLIFQAQMLFQSLGMTQFSNHLNPGFLTIWLGHTTLIMAFVTVMIRSRLSELDASLEDAAKDLGARPLKIFFTITLPLILPVIFSGFFLGITLSLDDLVITSFLSGPGSSTLPMVIFSKIRRGLDPQMNVLATILIITISTLVIVSNYFMMRSQTRREREKHAAEKRALECLNKP